MTNVLLKLPAVALAAAAICMPTAQAAVGDTATWVFNLQATGLPSTGAIDPPTAVLTGTEIAGGVQFYLNPDETANGYLGNPTTSFIERLTSGRRLRWMPATRLTASRSCPSTGAVLPRRPIAI